MCPESRPCNGILANSALCLCFPRAKLKLHRGMFLLSDRNVGVHLSLKYGLVMIITMNVSVIIQK